MKFENAISEIIKAPEHLTLLKAPTGWGKTRLMWDLLEIENKIVIIVPLTSLVHELSMKENVFSFLNGKKLEIINDFINSKKGILVVTAESMLSNYIEILKVKISPLFVLDEIHLFYKWGYSFRPYLIQFFEILICLKVRIMGLSATVEEWIEEDLKRDLIRNGYKMTSINIGNFENARPPQKIKYFNFVDLINLFKLLSIFSRKGRILIFVRTKREGRNLEHDLIKLGVKSTLCFGGEVIEFTKKEKENKSKVIIATSALSHGVNLENIRRVFISYIPEKDILYQMIARGGRRGEKFFVYLLKKGTLSFTLSGFIASLIMLLV